MNVPKDMNTDHINGNGLDNRRKNIRICTQSQNCQNRRIIYGTASKYKGVSWFRPTGKWRATIKNKRKSISLGYFEKEINAALMYDRKAKELFGEFANVNFV